MNDQRPPSNQSDDYDEDRTRVAPHRRPGQGPRPAQPPFPPVQPQPAPPPFKQQPYPPVQSQPLQPPLQGSPPDGRSEDGFSDDPEDRTNLAGPVRFQPTPIPPGQADRRRRRGVILVVGLALVLIAGAIVGILMLAKTTDQGDDNRTAPPEPGVVSYHSVVADVDEGAEPSEAGNMVIQDKRTGQWVELGPAVLDVEDVDEATAEFNEAVQGWVVNLNVKDDAMADYRKWNEDAACAKDELGKRVGTIVDAELVSSLPTNVPCGTDLSGAESVIINGGLDETEARELAERINED